MKHLASILILLLFSQMGHAQTKGNTSYETLWTKV
ncbi:MAG: hypothetical protein ACI8VZ_000546, partial [Candidatus Paceibacteria bacterium]